MILPAARSGLDADGAQQEGRQMSGAVVGISGACGTGLGARRGRASSRRATGAGTPSRRGGALRPCRRPPVFTVALLSVFLLGSRFAVPVRGAVRFALVGLGCLGAFGRRAARLARHPGNGLADQLFDRGDALGICRRDHGEGGAGAPGAAGAADAVDVIVGVMRRRRN